MLMPLVVRRWKSVYSRKNRRIHSTRSVDEERSGRENDPRLIQHGTTTLFAALNIPGGTLIGQRMARHRHQEFIRFLNRIEGWCPPASSSMPSSINYAAHRCMRKGAQVKGSQHWDRSGGIGWRGDRLTFAALSRTDT
jgi:hypothetical protein